MQETNLSRNLTDFYQTKLLSLTAERDFLTKENTKISSEMSKEATFYRQKISNLTEKFQDSKKINQDLENNLLFITEASEKKLHEAHTLSEENLKMIKNQGYLKILKNVVKNRLIQTVESMSLKKNPRT